MLALWFYFWDWAPPPPPTPVDTISTVVHLVASQPQTTTLRLLNPAIEAVFQHSVYQEVFQFGGLRTARTAFLGRPGRPA